MKATKYWIMVMIILLTSILSFIGCAEGERVRPPAQVWYYWSDTLRETSPLIDKLLRFEDFVLKEYSATLDKESAFISRLTDQELQSYEAYTKALDTEDNQATLERCKGDLEKKLSPEKLQTAIALCDLKIGLQYGVNQIRNDKQQLLNKAQDITRQIENGQFTTVGLSKSDYEETERLKIVIDSYRVLVKNTVLKNTPKDEQK